MKLITHQLNRVTCLKACWETPPTYLQYATMLKHFKSKTNTTKTTADKQEFVRDPKQSFWMKWFIHGGPHQEECGSLSSTFGKLAVPFSSYRCYPIISAFYLNSEWPHTINLFCQKCWLDWPIYQIYVLTWSRRGQCWPRHNRSPAAANGEKVLLRLLYLTDFLIS